MFGFCCCSSMFARRSFPFPVVHFTSAKMLQQECWHLQFKVSPSMHMKNIRFFTFLFSVLGQKKMLILEFQDLSQDEFSFFSSRKPSCLPPLSHTTQTFTLAREEPRTVSAAPLQQPTHIHFWSRALNCKACELKVKITSPTDLLRTSL